MGYKLPFVVAPRLQPVKELVGSENSGKIEIDRRGYLTVAEKNFTQGALAGDDSISAMHALASKIARKDKKEQSQVIADFVNNNAPYLEKYTEEVSSVLVGMLAYQEKYKIVAATALLISRIDASWTVEDTIELHPDLLDGLTALYEEEDRKCIDKLLIESGRNDAEKVEEAEGKE